MARRKIIEAPSEPPTQEYVTGDLGYAAYLRVLGVPILGLRLDVGKRYLFLFDTNGIDMSPIKDGWVSGKGMVGARQYNAAIREMKTLLHMDNGKELGRDGGK